MRAPPSETELRNHEICILLEEKLNPNSGFRNLTTTPHGPLRKSRRTFWGVGPQCTLKDSLKPPNVRHWPQVNEALIAEDVVADFDAGLEYAEAAEILRGVLRGDGRQFLVR